MDKKLNLTEFCDFFAKAAGVSLTEAEVFVRAFFDVIVEGLEKDGVVKINGLGTFKVIEVESRSSVNINTGERFEINSHRRLTFIPADSLKEIINAPFAMFEPVEVDDEIDDDNDEIKSFSDEDAVVDEFVVSEECTGECDSFADEGVVGHSSVATEECVVYDTNIEEEMPQDTAEEQGVSVTTVVDIEEEIPIEEADYISEDILADAIEERAEEKKNILAEEGINDEDKMQGPVSVATQNVCENIVGCNNVSSSDEKCEETLKNTFNFEERKIYLNTLPDDKRNRGNIKLYILFAFIIICSVFAFGGLYLYEKKSFPEDRIKERVVVKKVDSRVVNITDSVILHGTDTADVVSDDKSENIVSDTVDARQDAVVQEDSVIKEQQNKEEKTVVKVSENFKLVDALAARELSTIFVADTTDYKIVGTKCKHKVKSEETLIRISQKYYGDKRLWPYIVKYNNMLRPNDLACDMLLKIPILIPRK